MMRWSHHVRAGIVVAATIAGGFGRGARCEEGVPWWESLEPAAMPEESLAVEAAIDRAIDARLAAARVPAAAPADAGTLLRRLTFDLAGRVPTVAELDAFLADDRPDRAARAVDRLMASADFRRHQAAELDAALTGDDRGSLRQYLTTAIGESRGWDRIFAELIAARGDDADAPGADAFLKPRVNDVDRLANDVSVGFFGINISCAQCHDHPLVKDWKQDHYFGMKSFFSRTVEVGGFVGELDYGRVTFKTVAGESRTASLLFLSGGAIDEPPEPERSDADKKAEKKLIEELKKEKKPLPPPAYSRRAQLVRAGVSASDGAFFARAIVNRLWARFFGRGLVVPLDQMHSANPPSHPELLQWLAKDLASHGYDIERLIRGMASSAAYARSSAIDGDAPPPQLFAVAPLRPLAPRQMAYALRLATSDPSRFAADVEPAEIERRLESVEKSSHGLVRWFERPREGFQVSVDEALAFSNNPQAERDLLGDGDGALVKRLLGIAAPEARIDLAFRAIVSRPARPEETAPIADYLAARADRPVESLRQVLWALLAGAEFRFLR